MKKNFRVIQINGFRGLLVAFFTLSCLIAGFIAFPGYVAMYLWNYIATKTYSCPTISFWGGLLLWGIVAFSIFIIKKRRFIVSFNSEHELTEDEVQHIVSKIKSQKIHHPYMQNLPTNKFNTQEKSDLLQKSSEEKQEIPENKKD